MLKRWSLVLFFMFVVIVEGKSNIRFNNPEDVITGTIDYSDIIQPHISVSEEVNFQDTTSESSSADEGGFIKKLFTGATKAEKIAKKEKKNLSAINEKQAQFYGWYPYWEKETYKDYNFNDLTTVSFFSVDVYLNDDRQLSFNENGIRSKFADDLFKKAKSAGCRIDLTFKCEDEKVIDLILNNESARNECINYLTFLLDSSQLRTDGIAIVFENVPPNNSGSIILFIAQLKQAIKKSNRSIKLAIPEFDASKNYDILKLNQLVDHYLLIGNNFFRPETRDSSELKKNKETESFKVKESVKTYLQNGVPFNKLIVVLPNHGMYWINQSNNYVTNIQNLVSTAELLEHWHKPTTRLEKDPTNDCAYFFYEKNQVMLMCYPEKKNILEKHYKWLIGQGVAGIGIWALGYDDNDTDFWKLIDKNFKVKKLKPTNTELLIKKHIEQDTLTKYIVVNDSLISYKRVINDTLILDTLFNRLLLDGLEEENDSASPQKFITQIIDKFNSTFEGLIASPTVVVSVVATLAVFGFLGILGSLFFGSVRELLYIRTFQKYILIHLMLILFAIGLFSFLNLLRTDIEELSSSGLGNICIDFSSIKKGAWYFLLAALIIINLLSSKLVGTFSLKHEKP